MKQDPYFKFLAVVLFAGVIIALANPAKASHSNASPDKVAATHASSRNARS